MSEINRRGALLHLVTSVAVAPAVLRGRFRLFAQSQVEYSSRAIRLLQETPVVDLLNQFMFSKIGPWLREPASFSAADRAIFRDSGIDVFALGSGSGNFDAQVFFFDTWNSFLTANNDQFLRIDDASHIDRAHREKKIGVMLTLQDSTHFRTPDDVNAFFSRGQRISQLTYNYSNMIGSGFLADRDSGLTTFGISILKRMENVGMGVDVSHCGDQTTLDALDAATKPVLITHATCRGLVPGHLRAKTDEMIRKMAKTGGVMGIDFIRFLVRDREPVTVEHVLDHFDYMKKLVGVQYVAVGGDLDVTGLAAAANPNAPPPPANGPSSTQPNYERYQEHYDPADRNATVTGLRHSKRMFDLTDGLIRRGYSDAEIKMILGENAARVLASIWPKSP